MWDDKLMVASVFIKRIYWWEYWLDIDENIDQRLMNNAEQQSDEHILMCIAKVGCSTKPYDCLQVEYFTWGLDSSNPC